MNILLLNGPNLNMLGQREPDKYGTQTLQDIVDDLQAQAASSNVTLTHFQSNAEFELIDRVHAAMGTVDAIIINPAAFTHTSVALRDALLSVNIPLLRCICRTFMPVNRFVTIPIFLMLQLASLLALVPWATRSR